MDELTPYEIALLCGGPTRVAQCAFLALHENHRVQVSRGTRRLTVVKRASDDAVQAAILEQVPETGFLLRHVLEAVAESSEVRAIADGLRGAGLVRDGLRGRPRPTREGRAVRRRLRAEAKPGGVDGLAALGPAGVDNIKLREILETDDPKPVKLPYHWARNGVNRNAEQSRLSDTGYADYADSMDFGDSGGSGNY